jgi:hypothetical protein
LEDIETDVAVGIDIWVEHFCDEFHGGGFVGVLVSEYEAEAESAVLEGCVACSVSGCQWRLIKAREEPRRNVVNTCNERIIRSLYNERATGQDSQVQR